MQNKRGQISEEVLLFIPRIVFLIAIIFAVVLLVKLFLVTNIEIGQVESNILINRLIYSKDGLSYYDEGVKRLYPGVMDLNRFKQLSLSNPNFLDNIAISYGEDSPIIAAKITLRYIEKKEPNSDITIFYNKDRYDKWEPRTLSAVKGGAGSVKSFKEQRYVLIKDREKLSNGILEFDVIR